MTDAQRYCGWVPTVTGHLSFSTIGRGSFPNSSYRRDLEGYVVVFQRRDLLDWLVPYADDHSAMAFFREKLANYVIGMSGDFSFVLIAHLASDAEVLEGDVLVLPNALCAKDLKDLRQSLLPTRTPWPIQNIRSFCENNVCFRTHFNLQRGGRLEIKENHEPSEGPKNDRAKRILANQVFYFLKDISHVHQHHDPKHDAITELSESQNSNDESWIAETQHSLYRAIIRYKRFRNEKALFRASGILAYAQSFQRVYVASSAKIKIFNDEQLEKSLDVARDELRHFDEKLISQIETFKSFFFAFFGLIISSTFLYRLSDTQKIEVSNYIVWLTSTVASKPIGSAVVAVIISFCYMVVTHRLEVANSEMLRTWVRFIQSYRLRYFLIINAILASAAAAVCYFALSALFAN